MCWPVYLWALEANINSAWVLELCTILERKSRVDTHKASWAQNTLLSSIYRFWLSETFILSLQWSHGRKPTGKKMSTQSCSSRKMLPKARKVSFFNCLTSSHSIIVKEIWSHLKSTHTDKQALYIWCSVFWGQADLKKQVLFEWGWSWEFWVLGLIYYQPQGGGWHSWKMG